ncbi:hypothetical protein ACKWTF_003663 [Chironomus riparius]
MSSVHVKSNKIAFKNILVRHGSLDKIKCCAYSTLESMFAKKVVLINILEDTMNSSKELIQKPVNIIIVPSIQIFCVAMSILINLIRNQKFVGGLSFEKLEKFIIEFNQLKALRQRNLCKVERQTENKETDKVELTTETIPSKITRNDDDEIFYDCNEEEITDRKTDRFLKAASYASIVYIYAQLSLLVYLAGLSTLKLGILFMFVCVAAIAYFLIKMSFMKKSQSSRRCSRRLKAVKQKLFGKALTFRPITCVLPQIKFSTCAGKFPNEKQKSL